MSEQEQKDLGDQVRVLRILEYVGPREVVEKQLSASLRDGTHTGMWSGTHPGNGMTLRIATVGDYPEVLERGPRGEIGRDFVDEPYDGSHHVTEADRNGPHAPEADMKEDYR